MPHLHVPLTAIIKFYKFSNIKSMLVGWKTLTKEAGTALTVQEMIRLTYVSVEIYYYYENVFTYLRIRSFVNLIGALCFSINQIVLPVALTEVYILLCYNL